MITLEHVHIEIHDEVNNNDKVHYSFIKQNMKFKNKYKVIHFLPMREIY